MNITSNQAYFLAAIMAAAPAAMMAAEYTAPVSISQYTMASLAKDAATGVTETAPGVFTMTKSITIPAGNTFSISGAKEIRMANGVSLTLECKADLKAGSRVTITRSSATAAPKGIVIDCPTSLGENTKLANIDFEYVALRNIGTLGMDVDNCTFSYANGALNNMAALGTGPSGATYNITNCEFSHCTVPAIGGAVNYFCGLNIKGCKFTDNNTSNTNKPQINITVGGNLPVVVEDCTFIGAKRNMVGAIGVGNLAMGKGENSVIIRNCDIRDHRYGITGTGPMYMEIRDCNIVDNNHETNPMAGGSGINLAGYNYGLDAIVSGCHIENSLWGITLVGCRVVSLGEVGNPSSPGGNVFVNNGNGGVPYDLYNNGSTDIMAQNNTWSVPSQTAENIETVVFPQPADSNLGLVTYMPAKDNAGIADITASPSGIAFDGYTISAQGPVSVYSITGQRIASSATGSYDATRLPAGIYIARCGKSAIKFAKH